MQEKNNDWIQEYFGKGPVIEEYASATWRIGLWESEKKIFSELWGKNSFLLDIGCGAGRVALNLWKMGYHKLIGVDYVPEMVEKARQIALAMGAGITFEVGDARNLIFENQYFDGVIFSFNGLMQIPGVHSRKRAMKEIHRVTRPGGYFFFTSHDREANAKSDFWQQEQKCWDNQENNIYLETLGDLYQPAIGNYYQYIHSPDPQVLRKDLCDTGWEVLECIWRSRVCNESGRVREFSDDCRLWICKAT